MIVLADLSIISLLAMSIVTIFLTTESFSCFKKLVIFRSRYCWTFGGYKVNILISFFFFKFIKFDVELFLVEVFFYLG